MYNMHIVQPGKQIQHVKHVQQVQTVKHKQHVHCTTC